MRKFILYIIFIISGIHSVWAQYSLQDTISIKEIIINETKFVAGKVEMIEPAVIESNLNSTVADVLSENTTIYIHSAAKGSVATASMRGAGASHTKVLWGNMPINSPMTGQVDLSLLPLYFTDEISLHYGSASLINAGGALGGSILLNNLPNWQKGLHGKISQGIGSFGTYSTFGQFSFTNTKFTSSTRLFIEESANNYKYYNNTLPEEFQKTETQANADYSRFGFLQEASYRISDNSMLEFNYWYQNSERSIPMLMNNSTSEHDEKQFDKDHRIQAYYKNYGKLNWELSTGFSSSELIYYLKNQPLGSGDLITNINSQSQTYSSISQFNLSKKWDKNWKLDLQASMAFNFAEFYDEKYLTGYKSNQTEHSVFMGLHRSFGSHWNISAIVRQQLIDGAFIKPIPSIGFKYTAFDNNPIDIKANISRNYHNPTLNQLYFKPGGNPDLHAEEGTTSELSISSLLKAGNTKYKNEITAYYSIINDWILWKPSQFGYWIPENMQIVHSRGIEYTGKITRKVGELTTEVSLKYAFSPTTNESTNLAEGDNSKGQQLIYIPIHSGGYTVRVLYKGLEFVWTSYYTGNRNTSTANNEDNTPLPGYWLSNTSLGKKFAFKSYKFGLQFKVDNIFNVEYQSIQYRAMPGRSYYVMVKFEF